MMNRLIAGLVVAVGVLIGFYGGAKYGEAHAAPATGNVSATTSTGQRAGTGALAGANARASAGTGGAGGRAVAGMIVAVSAGTITVHDRQTNKDVKVDISAARISKTVQGSASDLAKDQTVSVIGPTGSDGTVSAQVVALGGGAGFGGGRVRPSPST